MVNLQRAESNLRFRRWAIICALIEAHVLVGLVFALSARQWYWLPLQDPFRWQTFALGAWATQPILLAIWAALGFESLPVRLPRVLVVMCLAAMGPFWLSPLLWNAYPSYLLTFIGEIWFGLFAIAGAALTVLRLELGWQLLPTDATGKPICIEKEKLSLREMFFQTSCAALVCLFVGSLRLLGLQWRGFIYETLAVNLFLVVAGLGAVLTVAMVRSILGGRRWLISSVVLLVFGLGIAGIEVALRIANAQVASFFVTCGATGFLVTLVVSLWVVRAAGIRMVRSSEMAATSGVAVVSTTSQTEVAAT